MRLILNQIYYFLDKLVEGINGSKMQVLFYSFNNPSQAIEVEYQGGETIQAVFQKMVETKELQEEIGYNISMDCVTIVLKKQQKKKVNRDELVSNVFKDCAQGDKQLLFAYPAQQGGVLIQFIIDSQQCYFQCYVNKNDQLQIFISKLLKQINLDKKIKIRVNGQTNNQAQPFQKKTIKQIITLFKINKIIVQINSEKESVQIVKNQINQIQEKHQAKIQAVAVAKDQQYFMKNNGSVKKESVLLSKDDKNEIKINGSMKKVQRKQSLKQQNHNVSRKPANQSKVVSSRNEPKIQVEIQPQLQKRIILQESQSLVILPKRPEKLIQVPKKKQQLARLGNDQKLKFQVSYLTNNGSRSQLFDISYEKTMQELLPDILGELCKAGFDWDMTWKDYKDKLTIIYGSCAYTKLQKRINVVIPPTQLKNQKTLSFYFRRNYEGG